MKLKLIFVGIGWVTYATACLAEPDIRNPGPELPTFPENVDTIPAGAAYVELSGGYVGHDREDYGRYNTPFLLQYGVTDEIELRVYDNGFTWYEGDQGYRGFEPPTFGALIHIMDEMPEYFLPAMAFEPLVTTNVLGNSDTIGGVQPQLMFTFVNSLPFDIQLNYTFGALRVRNDFGQNNWQFQFEWALQRKLFLEDLQVFIHGNYNSVELPSPTILVPQATFSTGASVIGGGFTYTVNSRVALFGQISGGIDPYAPSILSWAGFAVSF